MSVVHPPPEGESGIMEGGRQQAKELVVASSGEVSKLGGGPDKLTLFLPAADTGSKWKGGHGDCSDNSRANRPQSVGPSRGKSKVSELMVWTRWAHSFSLCTQGRDGVAASVACLCSLV